jgi:hypothetical protein
MRFSDLKSSIIAQFAVPNGNRVVPFIVGKPGGGKSALCREIAAELAKKHNIPEERIVEFNPSLREPADILGLPQFDGDHTRWLPPQEFYALRKGVGPSILIIEELSDATLDMQNPLCRVILDRHAGQMPLTDQLFILASGNRTEDKSGANRLSTKLGNRMRILSYDESLDDWLDWASRNGISPMLRYFIKWRPDLLSDFNPNRPINPTPRAWADAALVPDDLPDDIYCAHIAGSVGEGAAAEFVGFRRLFAELPDIDAILKSPAKAKVPTKPDVLFALSAKLVTLISKKTFDKLYEFVKRMPPEFVVMIVKDAKRAHPEIASTKAYVSYAVENCELLSQVVNE